MNQNWPGCSVLFTLALAMMIAVSATSQALTLTTAPTFTPAPLAPLAGLLQLSTDVASRVSVSVSDGTNTWQRNFYDYSTAHSVPLLGFKTGRTNVINVRIWDRNGDAISAPTPLVFVTSPLPADFPQSVLLTNQPALMEPGFTLFRVANRGDRAAYLTIVDSAGEVVWYSTAASVLDVRQLPNGDLFLPLSTNFVEIDMLGRTVQSWGVPDGLAINSHEGVPTPHNSILYINDAHAMVSDFPLSTLGPVVPTATVNVLYNNIIEMSTTNGALLNNWSLLGMLQPTRVTFLTYSEGYPDLEHANAVLENPSDDSIIVSLRHQNAVVKFSRATGQLNWILGPPANWRAEFQPYLLRPVGTPFTWSFGEHAPMLTPQGTLLVYDNGNWRADPFDPGVADANNYSRAVEYSVNEQTMEVSQVWEYSGANVDRLYTGLLGNTDWLPRTGNVLVTFGFVQYENGVPPSPIAPAAPMIRIKEVTHDQTPQVVFDLAFFNFGNTNPAFAGYEAYRSHRIPDLYSTLPAPVQDLAVQFTDGFADFQFSGSEDNTYIIQVSTDLGQWDPIGTAIDTGDGNFEFTDFEPFGTSLQYYRVLTK